MYRLLLLAVLVLSGCEEAKPLPLGKLRFTLTNVVGGKCEVVLSEVENGRFIGTFLTSDDKQGNASATFDRVTGKGTVILSLPTSQIEVDVNIGSMERGSTEGDTQSKTVRVRKVI